IPLADGRLALTVADASGHGVGPALVICATRALIRAVADQTDSPGQVLTRANDWLCADLSRGRFVTAFFGFLEPALHRLHYGSAGHGPMFWYRAVANDVTTTGATGLPLGIAEGMETESAESVEFSPGDLGIILTDGYLEAAEPGGAQFGKERLVELVRTHGRRSASELLERIDLEVRSFMGDRPQLDDQTALVVRRLS
ncbi:MAG: PP2C family protein-serine/threonine phosphatase, partial [Gemmataceae bacterium]